MLGKHHSKKSIEKMNLAKIGKHSKTEFKKGHKLSEETKNKMSLSKKGELNNFYGKHHTEKTKQKIIQNNHLGRHSSEETKRKLRIIRSKMIFPIKDTSIEIKIQNFLKQLNIEFFTHQYMKDIEHAYQCDILIPSMNLVIECDGNYWHKYPIGTEIDHIRTKELIEKGFKVLRLWEHEIKTITLKDFNAKLAMSGVIA